MKCHYCDKLIAQNEQYRPYCVGCSSALLARIERMEVGLHGIREMARRSLRRRSGQREAEGSPHIERDARLLADAYLDAQPPAEVLAAVESFESVDKFAWQNSLDEYLRVGKIMADYILSRVGEG